MRHYHLKGLLQNKKWITPAYVQLDEAGKVVAIETSPNPTIQYESIEGFALPGIPNTHSHAFQYAMVGLTEQHEVQGKRDDFWGWRKAMYQLALTVNPEQMEAIAAMLYMEMLRQGYTHVVEFHYVHHQPSGVPYSNIAELGVRLIAAAKKVGIKITLIPIYYQKGGFGQKATPQQRRFLSTHSDQYFQLWEQSKQAINYYEDAHIGYGAHSLRAIEPKEVANLMNQLDATIPFHIHVSEQLKEVAASKTYLGKRPVEWLLDQVDLQANHHLVHATHLTKQEANSLGKTNANVVLCPSTEGNLGDGIFPLKNFQQAGGTWSIGTDSHIGLNPFEELRLLDYGQRLTTHHRNSFTDKQEGNSGYYAFEKLILSGRKATGMPTKDFFEIGKAFDALILDASTPLLAICSPANLLSTIIYGSDNSHYLGTMINGEWRIQAGKHAQKIAVESNFIKALRVLKNR